MGYGPGYHYRATIVSVYDGDTCRADIELGFGVVLKNKTIRLANIDTAEMRGENKQDAHAARDRLTELIQGKEVVLQTIKDRTGKYGRIIGTIYLGGQSVNEMLVSEGLAEKMSSGGKKKKREAKPKKSKSASKPKEDDKKDADVAVKIQIPDDILRSVAESSEE